MVWLKIFIIFGLLLFIKIGPKWIGEIFGIEDFGSGLNMNFIKKLKEIPVVGKTTSTIGGAIGGTATGAIKGFAQGGLKGAALGAATGSLKGGISGANKVSWMGEESSKGQGTLSNMLTEKVEGIEERKELARKNAMTKALKGSKFLSKVGPKPSLETMKNAITEDSDNPDIVEALNLSNIKQNNQKAAGEVLSAKKALKGIKKELQNLETKHNYEVSQIEIVKSNLAITEKEINECNILKEKLSTLDINSSEYQEVKTQLETKQASTLQYQEQKQELENLLSNAKETNEKIKNLKEIEKNADDILKDKITVLRDIQQKSSVEQSKVIEKIITEVS